MKLYLFLCKLLIHSSINQCYNIVINSPKMSGKGCAYAHTDAKSSTSETHGTERRTRALTLHCLVLVNCTAHIPSHTYRKIDYCQRGLTTACICPDVHKLKMDTYGGIIHGFLNSLPQRPGPITHCVCHPKALTQVQKFCVLFLVSSWMEQNKTKTFSTHWYGRSQQWIVQSITNQQ